MTVSIEELQTKYNELLQRARPVAGEYRFLTERSDDGTPHVEIADGAYHYISTERGLDLSRQTFASTDEILYQMIADDTFWFGVAYEFKNRIENHDCRRMIFAKQMEMMSLIDPVWAERCADGIAKTLAENPYVDP